VQHASQAAPECLCTFIPFFFPNEATQNILYICMNSALHFSDFPTSGGQPDLSASICIAAE